MWKPWKKELHIQVSTEHGVISFSIVCPIFNELEEMCLLFLHTVPFSLELKELRNQFWKWMLSQAQLRKNYYINLESTLIRGVHASTIRRLLQRRIKYRKWKGRVRFIIHVHICYLISDLVCIHYLISDLVCIHYLISDLVRIHYHIFEIVYIFLIYNWFWSNSLSLFLKLFIYSLSWLFIIMNCLYIIINLFLIFVFLFLLILMI